MNIGKYAGLLTVVASALLSLPVGMTELVQGFDNLTYDFALSQTGLQESPAPLVLAQIDDATLEVIKDPLVLWPGRFAAVISTLSQAGASVVAVAYIPSVSLEEHAPHLDARLVRAIYESQDRGTRVVFGYSEAPGAIELPHPKYRGILSGIGSVDLTPDPDGVIRRYVPCHSHGGGDIDPSLPLVAAYLHSTGESNLKNLQDNPSWPCQRKPEPQLIDFRGRIAQSSIYSFIDLLRMKDEKSLKALAANVKGKVVLIGGVSSKLGQTRAVSLNPYDPAVRGAPETIIHLQAMETLLSHAPIRSAEFMDSRLEAMLCAALVSVIMMRFSALMALMVSMGLVGGWVWAAMAQFGQPMAYSTWPPMAGSLAAFLVTGLYIYRREFRLRSRLTQHFKSYVNQEVMDKILDAPETADLGGRLVYATVMFSDIRSFTSISERLEPHQVVSGLNRYFSEMTAAITETGGVVNKYMGDGILAIFGAPDYDPSEGALAAAWSSVKMLKATEMLNKEGIFPGFPEITMGVGLHCGEAIVGNIGCSDKMDYSIIGDTVNTAARIEGLTKEYGVPILMSEQLFENLKGKVEAVQLGSSLVKGKRKHIHIYTLKSILNHMERQALGPPEGEQNPEADKKEGHDNGEPVN